MDEIMKSLIDDLPEIIEKLKANTPPDAPVGCISTLCGTKIMVGELLPDDTIMVSRKLFNQIYESAVKSGD